MISTFISKFYNVIIVILSTLLVSILITLYFINAKNESLLNVLNEANKEIVLLKSNNISLKASLNEQNKKIESNRLDYEQKLKQYEDWTKQPVEVKYQYITKEVKSNECEDIKKSIDNSIDRLNAYRLHNKN
jgi:predicted PurR-regulated permease PerM